MSAWMRNLSGLGGFENSAGYSFFSDGPQSSGAGRAADSVSAGAPAASVDGSSAGAATGADSGTASAATGSDTGAESSPSGGVEDGGSEDMRQLGTKR